MPVSNLAVNIGSDAILAGDTRVRLHSSSPAGGNFGLLSGRGYEDVSLSPSAWTNAANGDVFNRDNVVFPRATSNWPMVTHYSVVRASDGSFLFSSPLASSYTIPGGRRFQLDAGTIGINASPQ